MGFISLMHWVQALPVADDFMIWMSHLGSASNSYVLVFPITYALDKRVGLMVFRALVFADYLNLLFKWVLNGDRPYWMDATLRQFPVTCETGPGSPSGHAMGTSAVWGTLARHLSDESTTALRFGCTPYLIWAAFAAMLAMVGLSRIYVACHYLYQVVTGVICGLATAKYTADNNTLLHSLSHHAHVAAAAVILLVGFVTHAFLDALGADPSLSLAKAQSACRQSSWLHVDTTPFFVLFRSAGAMVGLGVGKALAAAAAAKHADAATNTDGTTGKAVRLLITVAMLYLLEYHMPKFSTEYVTYALSVVAYAAKPVLVCALL